MVFATAPGYAPSMPEKVMVPDVWPPEPIVKHFVMKRSKVSNSQRKADEEAGDDGGGGSEDKNLPAILASSV